MTVFAAHARQAIATPVSSLEAKARPSNSMIAWCRFNQGITVTGSGVSQWDDASGNGNHLKQATDANRPLPGSLGSDIVTDGAFTDTANWTEGAGHSVTGGQLVLTAAGNGTVTFQTSGTTLVANQSYLVTFTISGYTSGNGIRVSLANDDVTATIGADGTHTEIITPTTINDQLIRIVKPAGTDTTLNVDDLIIQPITNDGILCDGVDDYLQADGFTFGNVFTIYMLGTHITWTAGDTLIAGATSNPRLAQQGGANKIGVNNGVTNTDTNNGLLLDTDAVVTWVNNADTEVIIQVNNGLPVSDTTDLGTTAMNGLTLAARGTVSNFGHIRAKEVIIYNVAHDAQENLDNILYLASVGQLTI